MISLINTAFIDDNNHLMASLILKIEQLIIRD